MDIIFLIIGLVLGLVIGYLIAQRLVAQKNTHVDLKPELESKSSQIEELKIQLKAQQNSLEEKQGIITQNTAQLARFEEQLSQAAEKLKTERAEIEKLNETFSLKFQHLANEIFEEKSKKFTDQNKSNIGELLTPLKEKITEFEKKVEQSSKDSIEQNSALKEQLNHLKELNQRITRDAENLTRALKGESKTQGNWGEYILESILEKSGLVKGREYMVQESLSGSDGKRYQPDVVVKLPDNKNIIIDSKVTLVAYERAVSAEKDEDRNAEIKAHLLSVRKHLKDLGEKNYQNLYGVTGLDFVLMFVPIEPAFSMAVQNDSELFNDAYSRNIVIVSPSTLIATLRTIANIWKNEYQNRNALEIARQGGALYDKFVSFTEDLKKVGKSLDDAKKWHDASMNKLTDGTGDLIGRTEKIRKLGAKTNKQLDQELVQKSLDNSGEEE